MNDRVIMALTGHAGSGKSAVAEYMHETYGFHVVDGGDLIRDKAMEFGQELRGRNAHEAFFMQMQKSAGRDWISQNTLYSPHERVVQSGLRSPYDLYTLKRHRGAAIIALTCPVEVRFERTDKTKANNERTIEDLIEFEESELAKPTKLGSHTQYVMEHADHVVDSSRSKEEVFWDVGAIVSDTIARKQA